MRENEQQRLVGQQKIENAGEKIGISGEFAKLVRLDAGKPQKARQLFRASGKELKRVDRYQFAIVPGRSGRELVHSLNCLSPTIGPKHVPMERIGGQWGRGGVSWEPHFGT